MRFYIADAFADGLFGGNPAGVVILSDTEDFPPEETMIKTAAELRYSETAFIKQTADDRFRIRYFTPTDEVDLCGHATIAAFRCLEDAGMTAPGCDCEAVTAAGRLTVKVERQFIMMEMAKPELISVINDEDTGKLYDALGIPCSQVLAAVSCSEYMQLRPAIISTGLPDIIVPVNSAEELDRISPDRDALCRLSEKHSVTGLHVFTRDTGNTGASARCRDFAPLYGIEEEAATGTASGALTYYMYRYGLIQNEDESRFIQGEAMGRPSSIYSHIRKTGNGDDDVLIQVGGSAVILAEGELHI